MGLSMWQCGISSCEYESNEVNRLVVHQATAHERIQCAICGTIILDGYFAIKHVFAEHTRAEYLRNYAASTDDIRWRENVLTEIEASADVSAIMERLDD